MKASLTQENLNKALSVGSRIVDNRPSLPVLANVLIKTDNNRLKLSSTNLEIGINHWIGAKIEKEGALTVPARLLNEYVASLPPGNMEIEADKQSLKLTADHYQSTINGIEADEFPSIPTISKATSLSLPAGEFKKALEQVIMAASADDSRPVLNGVYLYQDASSLVVVATDSYRLAEKKLDLGKAAKKPIVLIIPTRTMSELARLIEDDSQEIKVTAEENQVLFSFGDTELVSRLVDGQFPDYRQLIPKTGGTTLTIRTAEFINLTKVASLFARENAGSITLKVDSKAGKLSIRSIASQVGENVSEAAVKVSGEDAEVTLNSRYLLDGLTAIDTQEVTFSISGKINPCVLRPVGKKDYLHIVMPLRS